MPGGYLVFNAKASAGAAGAFSAFRCGLLGSLLAAGLSARRERQKVEALVRAYLIGILEILEAVDQ